MKLASLIVRAEFSLFILNFSGILVGNIYSDKGAANIGFEFQPLDLKNFESS